MTELSPTPLEHIFHVHFKILQPHFVYIRHRQSTTTFPRISPKPIADVSLSASTPPHRRVSINLIASPVKPVEHKQPPYEFLGGTCALPRLPHLPGQGSRRHHTPPNIFSRLLASGLPFHSSNDYSRNPRGFY